MSSSASTASCICNTLSNTTSFLLDVAKDSDASMGSRVGAAKDAVGDKMDESSHNVSQLNHLYAFISSTDIFFLQAKADVNKESAKH